MLLSMLHPVTCWQPQEAPLPQTHFCCTTCGSIKSIYITAGTEVNPVPLQEACAYLPRQIRICQPSRRLSCSMEVWQLAWRSLNLELHCPILNTPSNSSRGQFYLYVCRRVKKNITLPSLQLKASQKHIQISVLLPVTLRYASSPALCLS